MSRNEERHESVDPVVALWRKRIRSRSIKRSFGKWSRACWPFAFVAGAAVLSAGVVEVVETAARSTPRAQMARPDTPRFSPVENLLDVELFDQHFYWDASRIDHARRHQQAEITLSREGDELYDSMARDSFLGDPVGVPVHPSELSLPEDDRNSAEAVNLALPNVDAGPPSSAPEPTTVWLMAIGLCLLAARRTSSTPTLREARRRS